MGLRAVPALVTMVLLQHGRDGPGPSLPLLQLAMLGATGWLGFRLESTERFSATLSCISVPGGNQVSMEEEAKPEKWEGKKQMKTRCLLKLRTSG